MRTINLFLSMWLFLGYSVLAQWSSDPAVNNGIAITAGEQAIPKVATSPNGITYIAWFSNESGNYNVRLQKLNVFGEIQWEEGGILISDNPAMTWLTDWDMTVDQVDCAILTFQDIRNIDNDVFAYRIGPEGEFLWGDDGIEMSTGPAFDAAPKVCVTNSGNAVFAWQADEVVIRQKISPEGDKLWGENGITLSGPDTYSWPQLMPVGDDDVIMKYFEDSGPVWAPTRYVCAMRYDSEGNEVWDNIANISIAGGISAWTQIFPMVSDGNDGFFIAWHDDRDMNNLSSAFVQHIGSDGSVLLADNGVEASLYPNRHHFYPQLALPAGSEDIFVYWNEMDADQNNRGLYGQKISATGERLWGDNAKKFIEIAPQDVYPYAARSSDEDMVLFYEENASASNAIIKAMRIDTAGNFVWPDDIVDICSLPSTKVHTVSGVFHDGQWISAWEDDRNGNKDIYAQNLKLDGTLGPIEVNNNLTLSVDTLFFDFQHPYPADPIWVYNFTSNAIVIDNYTVSGSMSQWYATTTVNMPYELASGDSISFFIDIIWGDIFDPFNYDYDEFNVEADGETYTVVVAIQEGFIGIHENIKDIVKFYPNPSHSIVTFEFNEIRNEPLQILSPEGTLIKTLELKNTNLINWDLTNEAGNKVKPGVYFYKVDTNQGIESGKIIVQP